MSSSDWIIIPTIGENKNVPNHQHLRLLKLIPTYCAKNTFIHCTPSLRWLNLSKQSPSRNLQTMSTKRIWVNIWIDCTQKQRQICPQDVFFFPVQTWQKFPDIHSRVSLQFTQIILYHYYPLVIQHNYGKWSIYRWFVMIYLLRL